MRHMDSGARFVGLRCSCRVVAPAPVVAFGRRGSCCACWLSPLLPTRTLLPPFPCSGQGVCDPQVCWDERCSTCSCCGHPSCAPRHMPQPACLILPAHAASPTASQRGTGRVLAGLGLCAVRQRGSRGQPLGQPACCTAAAPTARAPPPPIAAPAVGLPWQRMQQYTSKSTGMPVPPTSGVPTRGVPRAGSPSSGLRAPPKPPSLPPCCPPPAQDLL